MILGSGDIAKVLRDRDGALFFASGVSNSNCIDESEFSREKQLLKDQNRDQFIFYFSTISVNFKDSPYTRHKLNMERLVKILFDHYCIIRLGNITWGDNPNTFLNYIRSRKNRGLSFEIRDEWKYMLDKEQLWMITDNIPLCGKYEISIFTEMKKVIDLI